MIDNQIAEAKPSLDSYELPCGFLTEDGQLHTDVTLREMTGEEEEILGAKNMPVTKKINKVLANCTMSIGPVPKPAIPTIIPNLMQGDRIFLLLAIRRVSLGDEMPFNSKCPSCDAESQFIIDLSDLDIKEMPDRKTRFYELELPRTKKKVRMKVLTGTGEDAISKASNRGKDVISTAIFCRVESIDDTPPVMKDIKKLPLMDRNFLKNGWEDHEGGVDTTIQIECPTCDFDYETELDISQEGFFNPSAALKAWKRKSSF
jgi:hypothetical protein